MFPTFTSHCVIRYEVRTCVKIRSLYIDSAWARCYFRTFADECKFDTRVDVKYKRITFVYVRKWFCRLANSVNTTCRTRCVSHDGVRPRAFRRAPITRRAKRGDARDEKGRKWRLIRFRSHVYTPRCIYTVTYCLARVETYRRGVFTSAAASAYYCPGTRLCEYYCKCSMTCMRVRVCV